MKSSLWDNFRKLVTLIDDLRDVGVQDYISLPRICVLGMQSAGKSSLLENIVGLDFLPRGDVLNSAFNTFLGCRHASSP